MNLSSLEIMDSDADSKTWQCREELSIEHNSRISGFNDGTHALLVGYVCESECVSGKRYRLQCFEEKPLDGGELRSNDELSKDPVRISTGQILEFSDNEFEDL